MNITYDYYRVFYYVARCGSFTRAAQALLSNQPNVSKAIQNLENQLGCARCLPARTGAYSSLKRASACTPMRASPLINYPRRSRSCAWMLRAG